LISLLTTDHAAAFSLKERIWANVRKARLERPRDLLGKDPSERPSSAPTAIQPYGRRVGHRRESQQIINLTLPLIQDMAAGKDIRKCLRASAGAASVLAKETTGRAQAGSISTVSRLPQADLRCAR